MPEPGLADGLVDAYLARLGVEREPPSVPALRRLHVAHVERVPYENVDIVLAGLGIGVVPPIDPVASVQRVVEGRGGYCYHLNGAFSQVLRALGYPVERHVGAVWQTSADGARSPQESLGNHCALTVDLEGGRWLADLGLGDGLHEPVPLVPATVVQGPFTYRIEASTALDDGWRFVHDPAQGSFTAMDFGLEPVGMDRFAAKHHELSTSPDSGFVKVLTVQRRDSRGVDALRGCVLTRLDSEGRHQRTLTTSDDWFAAVADVFALPLPQLDHAARSLVWRWLRASHDAWLESQVTASAPGD